MNDASPRLRLFEGIGYEAEYMIVDRQTLAVRPLADELLHDAAKEAGGIDFAAKGEFPCEVELGPLSLSNELTAHVIELKATRPVGWFDGLGETLQTGIRQMNARLAAHDACLLPTGMHPTMNPAEETVLWPHEYAEVYRTFDRIFNCRRHGWANLQSVHINLPFADDAEFARLHAAIRLVLPLLPALAASSPLREGVAAEELDRRLVEYRDNALSMPVLSARVIPETAASEAEYEAAVLQPIAAAMQPHNLGSIMQPQWMNARGAIARFDRGAIEIRLLDTQECVAADLSVAAATVQLVKTLCEERWTTLAEQSAIETDMLVRLLESTTRDADYAVVNDADYLRQFGFTSAGAVHNACAAGELWQHATEALRFFSTNRLNHWADSLRTIFQQGPLARRILTALGNPAPGSEVNRKAIRDVYGKLAECLEKGELFRV